METKIIIANSSFGRIDKFLSEKLKDLTRSNIKNIIDNSGVKVNEKTVKSNYKVKDNDIIEIIIPDPIKIENNPAHIELDIVYEDDDLLVVNKPKGMVVHPACGNYDNTLVNALLYHCKGKLSDINGDIRPGIVHRIDKDTSGLLIVAKTNEAHISLAEQIKEHSAKREYLALVIGEVKEDGRIDAPIGRSEKDRKKMAITDKNSREAVTNYFIKERYNGYTLLDCKLETGRTHQIRVHLKSIGYPILGDKVYGPKKQKINVDGQMLHAYRITFKHPITGKVLTFTKEPPEEYIKILKKLSKKV